jgi:phospholipase/lecithinase/hemolysin
MTHRSPLRRAALAVLAAALAAAAPPARAAGPYSVIYAFGDSLSDVGNDWTATLHLEPRSPPYYRGRFSNGPVWLQDLSATLGLPAPLAFLLGGSDFADGGAESGATIAHALSPIDLPAQLAEFTGKVTTPRKNALFTLWIGANDLFDMLGDPNLTQAQLDTGVTQVVGNVSTFVSAIALLGARNLLLITIPDLGTVPTISSQGPAASAAGTALAAQLNAQLVPAIRSLAALSGIALTVVDSFSALDAIIADPQAYGFTDATDPCWTGTYLGTGGTLCAKTRAAQDGHLFWDSVHPTAAGHAIIASTVAAALPKAAGLFAGE